MGSESALTTRAASLLLVLEGLARDRRPRELTSVYRWGLITRPHRQVLRMGMDSLPVLVLYTAGIAGLIAVTNHQRSSGAPAPTLRA